jgi:hypothetical protein
MGNHKGYPRTALAAPFNPNQAGLFKGTQRPAFCIGLDAPIMHHKVGNDKGVSFSQPLEVPECQPDQQSLNAKVARLTYPRNVNWTRDEFPADR